MSTDATVTAGPHYLRRDGHSILPVGAHYVPVEGPDWPWRVGADAFDAAFASMAAAGMDTVRIDLLWAAVEPEPGKLDEAHLTVLDEVVEAARRHGLLLHPTFFIGGEVGDAYWDVPWRDGRHPHRDPELLALQAAHVRAVARRWRGDPTIVAWDLTDEPPLWIFRDTTDDDARAWTATLVDGLRDEDPAHLITIGTSGQEVGAGAFRADVVAGQLDFACVHPYPIYQEDLYPDALLSPRMTLAAAFETALASGAGKPVMVHEYGASSAQFDPERIAAYDRLLTWSSFGRGAIGYYAWCWTDAEPAAFGRVPYVRQPHETQFGVTDHIGALRPRGRVLADAAARIRALDLDAVAGRGPAPATAAIPVPHEYVRPYDPEAYGIADAPAGPYVPAETAWNPERDPRPLVRGWLNAFVLACRADLRASFPRERLDGAWPEVPVMLVPAPLTSTTTSLYHVRTDWWRGADAHLARGGALWLSCSADSAIPEMEAFAGCRLADRAPEGPATLRFAQAWGPFAAGDTLDLPAGDDSLHTRGARLLVHGADVVATDDHGEPAIVRAAAGVGSVVTCAYPVELLLAGLPDAHGPEDRAWGLYDGLLDLAGLPRITGHPDAVAGVVLGETGSLTVVTNHGPTDLALTVALPDGAQVDATVSAYGDVVLEGGLPA
ncbi:MAG: glycoside hydrolase 5 family protein [Planctomycetaceae bacterium]